MSLRLRQAIPGRPSLHTSQNISSIHLQEHKKSFIVYPSASNVVLLDTNVELVDTLQFWSALPYRAASSSQAKVEGVLADSNSGLLFAWSGSHLVSWRYTSSKGKTGWVVHSTLILNSGITSMDFNNGLLVVALKSGIEAWKTDSNAEIAVWDKLWDRPYTDVQRIIISPSSSHISWHTKESAIVSVLALDRKAMAAGIPQELRHPRLINWIGWRQSTEKSGDAMLYTITTDQVFRIYSAVLDDPSWFQLLSSLDARSFHQPTPVPSQKGKQSILKRSEGVIWPMDRRAVKEVAKVELEQIKEGKSKVSASTLKLLESINTDEGDLVLWVGQDGTVALRSVVNIDRKPPTLIKSLPVARLTASPDTIHAAQWTSGAQILYDQPSASSSAILPPTSTLPTVSAVRINFRDLLSSIPSSIASVSLKHSAEEVINVQLEHAIDHFVRTPNGRGLLALTEHGEIGVWYKERLGKMSKSEQDPRSIVGKGQWTESVKPKASAIFSKGRAIVFFTDNHPGGQITLQHLDYGSASPTAPVTLPDFELDMGDDIACLLAVSDIDDGFSGRGRRTQRALIIAASQQGHAWIWKVDSKLVSTRSETTNIDDGPDIRLLSHYTLPVEGGTPHLILPVDPMGWHSSVVDWKNNTPLQDMILTVSKEGVLEFWSPELGHHYEGERPHDQRVKTSRSGTNGSHSQPDLPWKRTGQVRTGRSDAIIARCSSRKKTVLVTALSDARYEMTIWDSNVSEFSTGLELTHIFDSGEKIQDLDWTTTSDLQSVLAVGFPHRVILVCEQRSSYTEASPGWAPFLTIDLEKYTSIPISDSIWLAGGSLAIGAGNQIYLFSRFLDRGSPIPSPSASVRSMALEADDAEDIFQLIAWQNGPLWDYHPTVLAQCLLWDKVDLVKTVLVDLLNQLKLADQLGRKRIGGTRLEPDAFYRVQKQAQKSEQVASRRYDGLFDPTPAVVEEDEDDFTAAMVQDLISRLNGPVSIPLGQGEKSQLAIVAQAALEVERDRRSLDKCGLRYLLSIKMAANTSHGEMSNGTVMNGYTNGNREPTAARISFRNFVWAMHSESQELLLNAAVASCDNGKMLWADAKRLGVFLWLKSSEGVKSQLEIVARNQFMAGEDRDPTSCSLIFFALGKKKVVHGLWRQAPGHKEQQMMHKFLANDFELDRWKSAAVKNAYALLSKQRYEYAAAFFMLGGCPKDAINVCLRQLDDWQLAYALARAVEGGTDGPIVKWILEDTVVPLAMEGGHRWLATWAFWILGRRDLAVRVLISPMEDVASSWSSDKMLPVGNPENDDPSLLLLFQHLKSKSLQTAKGTSEIPEKTEFDFVLHNARVFFRMGCHSLGLSLLRSWSFDRPFFPAPRIRSKVSSPTPTLPGTPLDSRPRRPSLSSAGSGSFIRPSPRRPSFMLSGHARRESMVMDMDPLVEGASEPASRVPSPPITTAPNGGQSVSKEKKKEEGEVHVKEEPRKMGNLMKELKQDVQQGAMEFNMDNFF